MVRILGISGSLRGGSYNTALLRAGIGLIGDGAVLEPASIRGIPLYDGDVEATEGLPPAVQALKARVMACDGLLLATPQYKTASPACSRTRSTGCRVRRRRSRRCSAIARSR